MQRKSTKSTKSTSAVTLAWSRHSARAKARQRRIAPEASKALRRAGFRYVADMGGAAWWLTLDASAEAYGQQVEDQIAVCGSEEDGGDVRRGAPIFLIYYTAADPIRWVRVSSLAEALKVVRDWTAKRPRARAYNYKRDGEI